MLKRSDKMDLAIRQEIKNYQDSLNFVLESIRSLNKNIEKTQNDCVENVGILHAEHTSLINRIENKITKLNSKSYDFDIFCSGQKLHNTQHKMQIDSFFKEVKDKFSNLDSFSKKIEEQNVKIMQLEEKLDRFFRIADDNITELNMRTKKDLERTREEIISLPSTFEKEKKDLEEKLNSHIVDVDGILKEIRVSKREVYVLEKKIEHLYILIGRQKEAQ